MSVAIPILVIIVLIVINGLFVAAEFAIIGSKKPRIDTLAAEGNRAAVRVGRVLKSAANKDRYVAAAQLGITLASIGLGMYGERSVAAWLYGPLEHYGRLGEAAAHTVGTIVAVTILTYFHVVLGEMVPKAMALQAPEKTAFRVSRPMQVFGRLFAPAIWLLNGTGTLLLKLFNIPAAGHGGVYSVNELEQLVEESFAEGQVAARQHEVFDNIFTFSERSVRQLMTPRVKVVGVPVELSGEALLSFADDKRYSRYPVYKGDLDHIVGVLHIKDVIHAWSRGENLSAENLSAERLMHRAPRVPEALAAERLLPSLKRLKVHMAVVMNEHGGTAGIITLEDVLEAVIGDVQDEFDDEEAEIQELEPGVLSLQGDVLIAQLNERYRTKLGSDTAETVAGLVVDELGRPPVVGDVATQGDVRFEVETVEGLAVTHLKVRLPASESEEGPLTKTPDLSSKASEDLLSDLLKDPDAATNGSADAAPILDEPAQDEAEQVDYEQAQEANNESEASAVSADESEKKVETSSEKRD